MAPCQSRRSVAGFTLIEALAGMVLMGMILAALGTVTAQWLPNWNRGFASAQRSELVSIVLNRLVADLGAAEFVAANRDSQLPVFDGTPSEVTLVRTAFGPNSRRGLEAVRIAETSDRDGTVLVRSRVPFVPLPAGTLLPLPASFADPVAMLRRPFGVIFAYAGRDGVWKDAWQNAPLLPSSIRLTVRDMVSGRTLAISTAAVVHVELPAACVRANNKQDCASRPDQAVDASQADPSHPTAGAALPADAAQNASQAR